MICPYIESFQYHEQLNVPREYEPDYLEKVCITNVYMQMKCKEEGCAVWDKEERRCRYNG